MTTSTTGLQRSTALVLFALAVGGFAIGTTEFATMSLLPYFAPALGIDAPTAGHVISAYALGVVVGAPLLAVLGARLPRRTLLVLLMALFAVGNGLSALAPTYHWMLLFRFISGLPHGAYFGIAALVAASIVPPHRRTVAVGRMFLGLTVATIIGVPLANWLSQAVGWRWSFALVAALGVLTMICVRLLAPYSPAEPDSSPLRELGALKRGQVWLTLGIGAIGFGGLFAVYTYLADILGAVTHVSPSIVPLVMAVFGFGMTLGNLFEQVAQGHTEAEHRHHQRYDARRDVGDGAKDVGQVGVHREQAAEADGADAQGQPDLPALERTQLAQRAGVRLGRRVGREQAHADHGQHAQCRDQGEAPAPAHGLAQPVGQRHADDGGDGEAEEHPPDCHGAPVRRHDGGGDQRGDAEVGAVGQAADEAEQQHPVVGRRQCAEAVADGEQRHQQYQQGTTWQARAENRQQRRTDHHTQGVGADHVAGGGGVDAQRRGEVGQQAHGGEFGGADGEAADSKGEKHQGRTALQSGGGGRHWVSLVFLRCAVAARLSARARSRQ